MNLTDKARRGSQEAMEALFDMTKNDVAYLCRLLLGDNQASGVAVPRIYRSLWEQVLAGRITTEEDFAQAALVKTAAFCKTVLTKKASKSFRIPQNRDFVLGTGRGRGKHRLCLLRGGGIQRRGDFQRNLRRVRGELHPFRKLHCFRGHQLLRNLRRGQRSRLIEMGKPACGLAFSRKKTLDRRPPVWLHKKSMAAALPPLGGESYGAENTSHHRL